MWPSLRLTRTLVPRSRTNSGMIWLWVVGLSLPGVSAWPASSLGAAPASPLTPWRLCLHFEDSTVRCAALVPPRRNGVGFWAPLMGFLQRTPLRRHELRVSSPGCPGLGICHFPERVPSLSFLPTSTVYSTRCLAGLLHPAADPGVRLVSSRRRREPTHDLSPGAGPSEAFPSAAAGAVTASPRRCVHRTPFPSRRCSCWHRSAGPRSTSGV